MCFGQKKEFLFFRAIKWSKEFIKKIKNKQIKWKCQENYLTYKCFKIKKKKSIRRIFFSSL